MQMPWGSSNQRASALGWGRRGQRSGGGQSRAACSLADPRGVPPAGMWGHWRSGGAASLSVAAETVRTRRGGERGEAASPPIQISGLRMGGVAINQDRGLGKGKVGEGHRCMGAGAPRTAHRGRRWSLSLGERSGLGSGLLQDIRLGEITEE